MAGLNITEVVELAVLLVAVGGLSGFLAGVFGIGGGAILVPVFYVVVRSIVNRFSPAKNPESEKPSQPLTGDLNHA